MPAAQRKLLDQHDPARLLLSSGTTTPTATAARAVALGLVSLCNHSRRPNARVRRNRARETLDLLALTPIAAGDEITIDYNCPLWFARGRSSVGTADRHCEEAPTRADEAISR